MLTLAPASPAATTHCDSVMGVTGVSLFCEANKILADSIALSTPSNIEVLASSASRIILAGPLMPSPRCVPFLSCSMTLHLVPPPSMPIKYKSEFITYSRS